MYFSPVIALARIQTALFELVLFVIVYETTPAVEDGETEGGISYLAADWKGASSGTEEGGAEG